MNAVDDAVDRVCRMVKQATESHDGALVLGICGAQGSGKSTVAAAIARQLALCGQKAAVLSLDDLYLSRADRRTLARNIHPLFATRGVPGTHDVAFGCRVIGDLVGGRPTRLPRFDKAVDDPMPVEHWPRIDSAVDVILFEGWCVGAVAQAGEDLLSPVNGLEAQEDRDGSWRRHVNAALEGRYSELFALIDRLVLIAAPAFEVVARWRREQEHALQREVTARPGHRDVRVMTDDEVDRFVAHYERLTRHILSEMPARADLVLRLDANRRIIADRPHRSA